MSFSPNLFLSNVRAKDGLARPARFEIVLPIPTYIGNAVSSSIFEKILNLPNSIFTDVTDAITSAVGATQDSGTQSSSPSMSRYLALQCESTELPGRSLAVQDVKIYGPTFKVPVQTVYNDISFTFLCTNEFYERKLFDRWLEAIHPSDTNNLRYAKSDSTRYLTNVKIIQYDDFIKQIYAVELIDAFPYVITPQAVSWAEDGFHRLTVQFAYQKYRVIYDGSYNLADAATALFGTGLSRLLPFGQSIRF